MSSLGPRCIAHIPSAFNPQLFGPQVTPSGSAERAELHCGTNSVQLFHRAARALSSHMNWPHGTSTAPQMIDLNKLVCFRCGLHSLSPSALLHPPQYGSHQQRILAVYLLQLQWLPCVLHNHPRCLLMQSSLRDKCHRHHTGNAVFYKTVWRLQQRYLCPSDVLSVDTKWCVSPLASCHGFSCIR